MLLSISTPTSVLQWVKSLTRWACIGSRCTVSALSTFCFSCSIYFCSLVQSQHCYQEYKFSSSISILLRLKSLKMVDSQHVTIWEHSVFINPTVSWNARFVFFFCNVLPEHKYSNLRSCRSWHRLMSCLLIQSLYLTVKIRLQNIPAKGKRYSLPSHVSLDPIYLHIQACL